MQATAVVREAWELYKTHWRTFIPLALVVYLVIGVIALALTAALDWVGAIIGALLGVVGFFWLQGALVEAVRDVRDGRQDLSLGETFRAVQPRLPATIAAGLVVGIPIVICFATIVLIPLGLFLFTIWAAVIPTIVLEGKSAGQSLGRSRELVRGDGWSVFGVIVITIAAILVANLIVTIALFWLPEDAQAFLRSLISNTVTAPFIAVALTLTYYALVRPAEAVVATPVAPQPPPPA
jgi:hypothetical protein